MNLHQRSYQKELLDKDDIPFEDIKKNMQELNFINTWLGGHSITIKGLQRLVNNKKEITVCEIGCGGGDNLVAIIKWCNKKNISIKCIGIDIKEECIAFARQNKLLKNCTDWITSDYCEVQFEKKPDIIFSSLFCHHFTEEDLRKQIQWMKENCTSGFFINDLQRNTIAYFSILILTKLFSSSYLVKNDAPLSVARGFIKKEWQKIFLNSGIGEFDIQWKWAFRYLITYRHG
ncbi:MAG TPA: methyltransferase domain-containing protein [Chitinophagaceae bacterium]|jgi:2-polyprenyl-3-methyl-5-hydroxy-6-metoxy-1,4-benzoquinol methylase